MSESRQDGNLRNISRSNDSIANLPVLSTHSFLSSAQAPSVFSVEFDAEAELREAKTNVRNITESFPREFR